MSLVSSDHDPINDLAFTLSFDKTASIWKVDQSGSRTDLQGTWEHEGNVNFVVAFRNPSGMMATAADVPKHWE